MFDKDIYSVQYGLENELLLTIEGDKIVIGKRYNNKQIFDALIQMLEPSTEGEFYAHLPTTQQLDAASAFNWYMFLQYRLTNLEDPPTIHSADGQ